MKLKYRGFTLVELMISMSIIAILSVVLSVSFSRAQKSGRDQRRREDLKTIQSAAEQYYMLSGSYPTSAGSWTVNSQVILQKFPVGPKNDSYTYFYSAASNGFCACSSNMESWKSGEYGNADQVNSVPCDFQTTGRNYCVGSQQ